MEDYDNDFDASDTEQPETKFVKQSSKLQSQATRGMTRKQSQGASGLGNQAVGRQGTRAQVGMNQRKQVDIADDFDPSDDEQPATKFQKQQTTASRRPNAAEVQRQKTTTAQRQGTVGQRPPSGSMRSSGQARDQSSSLNRDINSYEMHTRQETAAADIYKKKQTKKREILDENDYGEEEESPQKEGEGPVKTNHRPITSWQDIQASSDTNKRIIFKFMRKGFTSLSAEELACTMLCEDFTRDFKNVVNEDWMVNYQFKVVERLQKCNFNFKWKTKPNATTSGLGQQGAFFQLCMQGNPQSVMEYLRQFKEPKWIQHTLDEVHPDNNKTGLHFAVENRHLQLVKFLILKGSKVDARDRRLQTPLHIACLKGYSEIVKVLIDNKSDPYERDISGRTCMHLVCCSASHNGPPEIMVILSGATTDLVHMEDHAGRTPLHFAVMNDLPNQIKIIQQLLLYEANINSIDHDRRTPLHYAAMEGKARVIPVLLQNGAAPGLKDCHQKTPMDLAQSESIRERLIVYSPFNNYAPSQKDLKGLQVEGYQKNIQKVADLPQTDYYEPYEHAQPVKKKKQRARINRKEGRREATDEDVGVQFVQYNAQPKASPERSKDWDPLGPAAEWTEQNKRHLPFGIRSHQAKLIEFLKRVQEFGVESYQHVKKPYLFSGSWMEYVRSLDDLMLQFDQVRSNEAVMKVFNILFPYPKQLPPGKGDELGLQGFYADSKPGKSSDLMDCHPDVLREKAQDEIDGAVDKALKANNVDNINDLATLEQRMAELQTTNEMGLMQIESKNAKIEELEKEIRALKADSSKHGKANANIIELREKVLAMQQRNQSLEEQNQEYQDKIRELTRDLEESKLNQANAEADERLRDEILQLNKKVQEMAESLQYEKQRNMSLRLKAGSLFMATLDDPNYQPSTSSGKIVDEIFNPEDDKALVKLMQKINSRKANLEETLKAYADTNDTWITQSQFVNMLRAYETPQNDYKPLMRISGFAFMQGDFKRTKVATIIERIYNRKAIREQKEHDTLVTIATYMDERGYSLDKLFSRYDQDGNNYIEKEEFYEFLRQLRINANNQMRIILMSMFDVNKDGKISKSELSNRLSKYTQKAQVTAEEVFDEDCGINAEDQKQLIDMVNEERREKLVYEDFAFDETDADALAIREAKTIELIKSGQLPVAPINGDIVINLLKHEDLTDIDGKNFLAYKLHRIQYTETGEKKKIRPQAGWISKFNKETGEIRTRIDLTDMNTMNMHAIADTMQINLFLADSKEIDLKDPKQAKQLSFIGKLNIRWKHCFDEDKKNEWQIFQSDVLDDEKQPKDRPVMISGRVQLQVRYTEIGQAKSLFNMDGTVKKKESKYGQFTATNTRADLREQRFGDSGTMQCNAKKFNASAAGLLNSECKYRVRFEFATKPDGSRQSPDNVLQTETSLQWMGDIGISVSDTNRDKSIIATLMMVKDGVETDVCKGMVPSDQIQQAYANNEKQLKSCLMDLQDKGGQAVGQLQVRLRYTMEVKKNEEARAKRKEQELANESAAAAAANPDEPDFKM